MLYPKPMARLVEELARLPGVGPKSAQRLAFHLLRSSEEELRRLTQAILEAKSSIGLCVVCQNLTEHELCSICQNTSRDRETILVVEEPKDVIAMERTHEYQGLYHVLHGALSPMNGMGPEQLKLESLIRRLQERSVREVILATNPDVEGEATALYLSRLLHSWPLKVTRIARGIPMGGELDYADEVTLVRALEGRREVS